MHELFKIGDAEHLLSLISSGDAFRVHTEGGVQTASSERVSEIRQRLWVNGARHEIVVVRCGDRLYIHLDGSAYDIAYIDPVSRFATVVARSAADRLQAPMPGAVIACAVKAGDDVKAGDLLMVIESMKLETPFKAWRAGRIEVVNCSVGQTFDRGAALLSMTPLEAA